MKDQFAGAGDKAEATCLWHLRKLHDAVINGIADAMSSHPVGSGNEVYRTVQVQRCLTCPDNLHAVFRRWVFS